MRTWFSGLSDGYKVTLVGGIVTALGGIVTAVVTVGIPLIANMAGGDDKPSAAPAPTTQSPTTPAPESPTPIDDPDYSDTPESTPSPSATSTPPSRKALAVGDLNFTGDNWVQGTWTLNGRKYDKSLAWVQACDDERRIVVPLGHAFQRFTAEVGFAQGEDGTHSYNTNFDVYADLDGDKEADGTELVASRGVTFDNPASIDAPIRGASQIILAVRVTDCIAPPLVWGSPQVS